MPNQAPLFSVKQLSDILKACFDNPNFRNISVYGEIYSIKITARFAYLEIGDQGQKQTNSPLLKIAFSLFYGDDYHLENYKQGDVIKVHGALSYYPHGSSITLWGDEISLLQSQQGKAYLMKQETLKKLNKLGYLDKQVKKPLPKYCRKVAIITAKEGAAYQDILKTLHDRFPVETVLYPAQVQGAGAATSLVKAIKRASLSDCDALIIGRGGGSKTDLSCFDDEKVCLAIAECPLPTITCIGHTIDIAIADRVSDYRAITPTEAASLINPALNEIDENRSDFFACLKENYLNVLSRYSQRLESLSDKLNALSPKNKIANERVKMKNYKKRLSDIFVHKLEGFDISLSRYALSLNDSFKAIYRSYQDRFNQLKDRLEVSYLAKSKVKSQVMLNGRVLSSVREVKENDILFISFKDGRVKSKVMEVENEKD